MGKICTDKNLLENIKKFEKENGRIPQARDFRNNPDYPNAGTYIKHFGSWNKAIELAGFEAVHLYTREELLEYMRQFYIKNGRPPTANDFHHHPDYPNQDTYFKYFETFQKALKLINLDVDTVVRKGILDNNQQKARLFELYVKEHFTEESIDLSGQNCLSPYDGICPTGQIYDAKSRKFNHMLNCWSFAFKNKHKAEIIWYYLGLFDRNFEKLLYVLRIPTQDFKNAVIKKGHMDIYLDGDRIYTLENMKKYNITEKFSGVNIL